MRPQILHHIPAGVTFEQAALTEPICVAYNALVEKTPIRPGDVVVIQGPGMIGLMALLVARLRGAGTLVVLGADADARRLETALQLGATHAVNVQREDPWPLIQQLGDGYGADLVVDCTGVCRRSSKSLQLVRPNGRITKVGWGPQPLDFSLDPLVAKAVTLQGSFSHTYPTWERVLALLGTGQIDLGPVIGGVYPLARLGKGIRRHGARGQREVGADHRAVGPPAKSVLPHRPITRSRWSLDFARKTDVPTISATEG